MNNGAAAHRSASTKGGWNDANQDANDEMPSHHRKGLSANGRRTELVSET